MQSPFGYFAARAEWELVALDWKTKTKPKAYIRNLLTDETMCIDVPALALDIAGVMASEILHDVVIECVRQTT